MLFLKNKDDLRQALKSDVLFTTDPVYLQLPEFSPPDLFTYEARINRLKMKKSRSAGIKILMIILAVLMCLYFNTLPFSGEIIPLCILMLSFICLLGAGGLLLHRFWVRMLLKQEVRKLLKRIHSAEKKTTFPEDDPRIGISLGLE